MWFFSKKKNNLIKQDKVWMHKEGKYLNLVKELAGLANTEKLIFLCSYFPDTVLYAGQLLQKTQTPFNDYTNTNHIVHQKVNLITVQSLIKETAHGFISGKATGYEVFMLEHHPLYSVENDFFKHLNNFDIEIHLTFNLSLDEPLFSIFGKDNIENMMRQMGMTEEEHITHTLITKAIENVQKKTEKKAVSFTDANNADEWYKKNMR